MGKRKAFTLFLTLIIAVFVLAACGSGGGNSGNADDDSGNNNADNGNNNADEEEITELTMGFIPSQDADELADTVEPLAERLSEELGVPVKASVMVDFVGLIEAMRTQQIDIGFLNPFGFVQAEDRANVEVILKSERFGEDSYLAQYNVRADSDIETIEDLVEQEGLVWAYADDLSTSGYLFPASQLTEMGIDSMDDHFTRTPVGGHDNALIALLDGQADFATTFDDGRDSIRDEFPDVDDEIRVIGYTDAIPNDTISIREGFPDEWRDKVVDAFLSFNDDEAMLEVLDDIYNWTGVVEAKSEDYDIVRAVFKQFEDELSE